MTHRLEDALDECLTLLATDEVGLEECLARYPEHAAELRRLLPLAGALAEGRQVEATAGFKERNRRELLERIASPAPPQPVPVRFPQRSLTDWLAGLFTPLYRPAYILGAIALFFLTAATAAAQSALPGDALYGWKLGSERVWRAVHPQPLEADLALSWRRANELAEVAGRPAAAEQSRQEYERALTRLERYADPASRQTIVNALLQQRERLEQAGIAAPRLDQRIDQWSPPETPAVETPTPETPTPDITPLPEPTTPLETPPLIPEEPPLLPTEIPLLPSPLPLEEITPAEVLPALP